MQWLYFLASKWIANFIDESAMILFACIFLMSKMNCKFYWWICNDFICLHFAHEQNELQVLLINLQCFYLLTAPNHQQQPITDHFHCWVRKLMSSRREAFGYVDLLLGISAMETVHLFAVACSMEKMERHSCLCMACFTEQGLEGSAR
jgi:hypothetical protein